MKIVGVIITIIVFLGAVPIIVSGPGGPIREIPMTQSWVIQLPIAISAWWVVLFLSSLVALSLHSLFVEMKEEGYGTRLDFFEERYAETFGWSAVGGSLISVIVLSVLSVLSFEVGVGVPILASILVGFLLGFFEQKSVAELGLWVGVTAVGILISLVFVNNLDGLTTQIVRHSFVIGGCACFGSRVGMSFYRAKNSIRARWAKIARS